MSDLPSHTPQLTCPNCGVPMSAFEIHAGLTVDFCQKCKGIWLDPGELARLCGTGEDIPEFTEVSMRGGASPLGCPKCLAEGNTGVCHRMPYSTKESPEIDWCPNCRGIWLDSGEIKAIQALGRLGSDTAVPRLASPVNERQSSEKVVVFNIFCILSFVAALITDEAVSPHRLILTVILFLPWVGLALVRSSEWTPLRGSMSWNSFKDIRLSFAPILIPLMAAVFTEENYLAVGSLPLVFVGIFAFYSGLFCFLKRRYPVRATWAGVLPLAFFYCALAAPLSNSLLDFSDAHKHPSGVIAKAQHRSHGFRRHSRLTEARYSMNIAPWKYSAGISNLSVNRAMFNALSEGDSIWIWVKDGLWGVPWIMYIQKATE